MPELATVDSQKRYGEHIYRPQGLTAEQIANGESVLGGWPVELAKDLVTAQARIAQLEAAKQEVTALGRQTILALQSQLTAAEATIARVKELAPKWLPRTSVERVADVGERSRMLARQHCADDLEAAISVEEAT